MASDNPNFGRGEVEVSGDHCDGTSVGSVRFSRFFDANLEYAGGYFFDEFIPYSGFHTDPDVHAKDHCPNMKDRDFCL
jgi:hypothetical protein